MRSGRLLLSAAILGLLAGLPLRAEARPESSPPVGSYDLAEPIEEEGLAAEAVRIARTADGLALALLGEEDGDRSAPLTQGEEGWTFHLPVGRGLDDRVARPEQGRRAVSLRGTLTAADEGYRLAWERVRAGDVEARGATRLVPRSPDAAAPATGRVRVAVSVDWEGSHLRGRDLRAMRRFREALPDVPLTHFLNAAYYTKDDADPTEVTRRIRRVLRPIDETGLHIHCWRSLVRAADVEFRRRPTFWGDRPLYPEGGDLGHEVELPAYEVDEIRALVRTSVGILTEHGFSVSSSFRAGGWMAPAPVLEAIRAEGFRVDSSATDPTWHDELAGVRLRDRIGEVWEGVTTRSQPWTIDTPAGPVLEIPDTGALADYITAEEMVEHLREAAGRLAEDPGTDVFCHIGFHQETAARYADRVRQAIARVRAEGPEDVVFETLEAQAAALRGAKTTTDGEGSPAPEVPSGPLGASDPTDQ